MEWAKYDVFPVFASLMIMFVPRSVGLYEDITATSDTVSRLEDNGGVYFVPGFHGLQAPVMDPTATAGFIGKNVIGSFNLGLVCYECSFYSFTVSIFKQFKLSATFLKFFKAFYLYSELQQFF